MEITKITANDYNCLKSLFKEEYDYHLTFWGFNNKSQKLFENQKAQIKKIDYEINLN